MYGLIYMLMYLSTDKISFSEHFAPADINDIARFKANTTPLDICQNSKFLLPFAEEVYELKFEEKPDIYYLRKLFADLFYRLKYEYDLVFDWMISLKITKHAFS